MRRMLLAVLLVSALAIAVWWPVGESAMRGSFLLRHVYVPVALALVSLLVWRMLRSLLAALAWAVAVAAAILIVFHYFGDALRPLIDKALP